MPSQTAENQTGTDQKTLWANLAAQLRVDSIRCTTAAGSGHPTSSMSAADLMAVLMTSHLRYDFDNPKHPNNDSLIFPRARLSVALLRL
jgi:transketolase